ncbi:transcription-repair coupling factor [Helicobacter pametensis]|uniref:transcription-repair coupling factor n=1 Tax=Helicobacter pametensis TaxID=95149 RepID=UPI00048A089A|nr:transcription-repair coupling factor [Helicobacter pametensis]
MVASTLYKLALDSALDFELLLCMDGNEAQNAFEMLEYMYKKTKIKPFLLPEFRAMQGDDLRSFSQEFHLLCEGLRNFYRFEGAKILISPLISTVFALPAPKHLQGFLIHKEMQLRLEDFKKQILDYGYEPVELVELEGEVSFRGDIVDLFVPNQPRPIRISFFDEWIEDIRGFECETQLCSGDEIIEVEITPSLFVVDQPEVLQEKIGQLSSNVLSADIQSLGFWVLPDKILLPRQYSTRITLGAKEEAMELFSFGEKLDLDEEVLSSLDVLPHFEGYSDILFDPKSLASILKAHASKTITLLAQQESYFEHLAYSLDLEGVCCKQSSAFVNILTPNEVILSLNQPIPKKKKRKPKILLDELSVGEYVVHSEYGVGVFRGIEQTEILGSVRDFIRIDYQGEDRLLLPVENLHLIDRYIANSGGVPMIDRLGKGSFAKLKEKVRSKLLELASGIVALAAKRDLLEGHRIDCDLEEIVLFQKQCPFALTLDQEKSIQEIFADLKSGKVMDRLLSGDVGFGKTEVAMNALFATCKNGLQGVLIAPTTLLSLQHFKSLSQRFEGFGVRLARLDGSIKNKTEVLNNIAEGRVDIVVGTHSILGATFKNLGLVVVDEEHKFGVKQKEKIKELSQNVHLLCMSATPIPRTLNMALSQIKGMSTLLTPPREREGVRTFVKVYQDALIKEVISRELRRGGQIFFIHNHISSIDSKKNDLLELLPHLRIAILHSQIPSVQSEKIMQEFAEKKYDLLLCTSIVESGIHLSNANTMVVESADRFGIADLHQLRGRVGRGDKEGFCYFLIEDKEKLTPEALKRLNALEKNSYLGSGASLAYHDLEIRGGGNLLGEAQSGHIKNIGYSLYLRMLEDCIHSLSGQSKLTQESVDLKLNVSAYLNPELIGEDRLRLELYRRLSLCKDSESVFKIQAEIEDRFGKIDVMTKQFLDLILIKVLGRECQIKTISNYGQNISLVLQNGEKETLRAASKDDDDVLACILQELRNKVKKLEG